MTTRRAPLPRTRRKALAAAILLFAAAAILALVTIAIGIVGGRSATMSTSTGGLGDLGLAVAVTTFAAVGSLLVARGAGRLVGPICIGIGIGGAAVGAATACAVAGVSGGAGANPIVVLASWLSGWLWIPVTALVAGLFLVFPDGRLPSRRWRWIAVPLVTFVIGLSVATAIRPGPLDPPLSMIDNPFGVPAIEPLTPLMLAMFRVLDLGFAVALAAQVVRFRRARGAERAQLKWFASSALGFTALYLVTSLSYGGALPPLVSDGMILLTMLAMAAIPASIGIAILRYRLFEIDRIISRTVSWALITTVLVAVFAGGVVALQAILTGVTQGQTLAVAASTLVAFALFQPVRRRVQAVVDQRFDRARYDAALTVESFASRLRSDVDLDAIRGDVSKTVAATVRPLHAAVWIRPAPRGPSTAGRVSSGPAR